jgi:hypothetical protein
MSTLTDHIADLTVPFCSSQIDLKPGALTKSRDRALALAYADTRVYQERLDQVVGPEAWHVQFQVAELGVLCTLTICGVTKTDVGDFPLDSDPERPNENRMTSAAAQAFKRACAVFGVGRYLYELPRMWADYDPERRAFCDPQGVIIALYHAADIAASIADGSEAAPVPATPTHTPPDAQRLKTARAALADAEQRTRTSAPSGNPASDAQLGLIARLIISLRQQADDEADVADTIDALGELFGLTELSSLTRKDTLRLQAIPKATASTLIERLKALEVAVPTAA